MAFGKRREVNRREFMVCAGAGAAGTVLAAYGAGGRALAARKPNVVYAFSDEHRWQSMSIGEMPMLHTPNMAALAAQGISFTNCISNYPVCSPHRAILMTGRWPYQQGMIDNNLPLSPEEMTLGKAFKGAGYDTAYIGKWHLGGTRAEPFGFDLSLIWSGTNEHWDKAKYHPKEGGPVQPKGYNATLMTDQLLAYIEQHEEEKADRPFFAMISWNPPHSKFRDPPEAKRALYPEGSLPYRKNVERKEPKKVEGGKRIWDQNSWPFYQGYHAHISAIDDELGRVMAKLDELGMAENTILVYSSDHGTMMGSHGVGSKRQPYEESIRVPFLIRWPGVIPAGTRPECLFGTIDVMPTLCSLAGVGVPKTCMGQDFSPWLRGGEGPDPEAQFIMHISKEHASNGNKHPAPLFRGIRTRTHTYAYYPDRPWCLFDNREDPYQMKNLMEDAAQEALRRELDAKLKAFLDAAKDPFELKGTE